MSHIRNRLDEREQKEKEEEIRQLMDDNKIPEAIEKTGEFIRQMGKNGFMNMMKRYTFEKIERISDEIERETLRDIAERDDYRSHKPYIKLNWENRVISLHISDAEIGNPEAFSHFTHLYDLFLGGCSIKDMDWLRSLINLEKLTLSHNKIEKIEGLEDLKKLKELDLCQNQIREIDGLEDLRNLEKLDLQKNQIKEIKGLENLVSLELLNLRNNQITEISGLCNLKKLRFLHLEKNQITEIKGLENLENIHTINLENNRITKINGLKSLSTLHRIDLTKNQITELRGINGLFNLVEIDVGFNLIKKVCPIRDVPNLDIIFWLDPKYFTKADIEKINQQLGTEGLKVYKRERGSFDSKDTPYFHYAICPKPDSEDLY